jgi:hypothetical protein
MPTAPDINAVKAYLGPDHSWTDAEITSAIAVETVAQQKACRFPSDPEPPAEPLPYPADLAEALKRRVAANLAKRSLPLGFQASATEFGTTALRFSAIDVEVRRLEAPYRRLVVA